MNENDTPTNKQNGDDAPLFHARTFPAVYLTPGDHPPAPPMVESEADQQTRARLMQEAADASERAVAGIVAAFEKAHWMDKIFTRIRKTLSSPDADHLEDDAAALIHAVEEQARTQGPEAIALAFDCLSLGVKFGRVRDTREIVAETLKEQTEVERKEKEEADKRRQERRAQNNLPKWGEDELRRYDAKILDLIRAGYSDRKIMKDIPAWAKGNRYLNPFRIPSPSSLRDWAAIMRGTKKKRKRTH